MRHRRGSGVKHLELSGFEPREKATLLPKIERLGGVLHDTEVREESRGGGTRGGGGRSRGWGRQPNTDPNSPARGLE